jgi:hypothetical protein
MTQPDATVVTPVPEDSATPTNAPVLVGEPEEARQGASETPAPAAERLVYRLLTGPDDHAFCARVAAALADGYRLYGSPSATFNGERVIVAQAVVLADRVDSHGRIR